MYLNVLCSCLDADIGGDQFIKRLETKKNESCGCGRRVSRRQKAEGTCKILLSAIAKALVYNIFIPSRSVHFANRSLRFTLA